MLLLLASAGLAWGFARVLDAPRWVERSVPLVALLIALAAQLALPQDNAFRQSVGSGLRAVLVLAALVAPVWAYLAFLRRVRRRHAPAAPLAGQVVRIADDAALRTQFAVRRRQRPGFGLIRRGADGAPDLVALVDRDGARLVVSLLWWQQPEALAALVPALAQAAREDGARQVVLVTDRPEALEAFRAGGYQDCGRVALSDHPDLVTLAWTAP